MHTVTQGFGGDLMQRRGGVTPGSPPQERCDGCEKPLPPPEAIEVTISTPTFCVRLYGHPACKEALAARARVLIVGVKR